MSLEIVCRLCLQDGPDLMSIYDEMISSTGESLELDVAQLVLQYLPIEIVKVESIAHPSICSDCRFQIEQWHQFYTSCLSNDDVYQERLMEKQLDSDYFPMPLKEEVMDDDDDDDAQSNAELYLEVEPVDVGVVTTGDFPDSANADLKHDTNDSKIISPQKLEKLPKKRGRPRLTSTERKLKQTAKRDSSGIKPSAKKNYRYTKMCPICGIFFSNLPEHLRKHQNDRKYQCPHCPKTFIGRSNYFTHVNMHTREKMYKCTQCDKQYIYPKSLKMHLISHVGERTFECTICHKTYLQKNSLDRHRRNHFEEPKIECSECGHRFYTRGDLNKHITKHQTIKAFSCEICGRPFGRKDNLRTHMKVHQK